MDGEAGFRILVEQVERAVLDEQDGFGLVVADVDRREFPGCRRCHGPIQALRDCRVTTDNYHD